MNVVKKKLLKLYLFIFVFIVLVSGWIGVFLDFFLIN